MAYPPRPPRNTAHIPVIITQDGQSQSSYITNINAFGACLTGVKGLHPHETILLRGVVEATAATVRWDARDRIGVYFEKPIPPQYLSLLRWRDAGLRAISAVSDVRVG